MDLDQPLTLKYYETIHQYYFGPLRGCQFEIILWVKFGGIHNIRPSFGERIPRFRCSEWIIGTQPWRSVNRAFLSPVCTFLSPAQRYQKTENRLPLTVWIDFSVKRRRPNRESRRTFRTDRIVVNRHKSTHRLRWQWAANRTAKKRDREGFINRPNAVLRSTIASWYSSAMTQSGTCVPALPKSNDAKAFSHLARNLCPLGIPAQGQWRSFPSLTRNCHVALFPQLELLILDGSLLLVPKIISATNGLHHSLDLLK